MVKLSGMKKQQAIDLLGGSVSSTAQAIGVEYQAVAKWPDVLPRRIEDRVIAALARQGKPIPSDLITKEVA